MRAELFEYESIHGTVDIYPDDSEMLRFHITGKQHLLVARKLIEQSEYWKLKGYCEKYGVLVGTCENLELEISKILEMLK